MAGPLAGISAAQIAQQKVQDQSASQVAKQQGGASKFDQAMGAKQANQVSQANQVAQTSQVNQAQAANKIDTINKLDKMSLKRANAQGSSAAGDKQQLTAKAMDPVTQKQEVSKGSGMLMGMMNNMEQGQASIDKLINGGLGGKNFNNSELLALQAGMYKYTQELDLTSKVVEKATSGLKDTLKTQV